MKRWLAPVAICLVVISALLWRLNIGPQTLDDAYITYRYARNMATNLGFVYNPGEYVLGTTTPAVALLLAAGYPFAHNIPATAFALGVISDLTAMLLLFVLARQQSESFLIALSTTIIYGFSWFCVRITTGGMESALFTLCILATIWAAATRRHTLAAVFAAIATLVRPEGLLVAFSCLVSEMIVKRRWPLRSGVIFAVILLPWLLFALSYFGSPIPHSMQAKAATFVLAPFQALKSIFGYLAEALVPFAAGHTSSLSRWLFTAILLILVCMSALVILRRHPWFFSFWVFPIMYVVLYAVANPPVWEWYVAPLYPFAAFAVVFGIAQLTTRVSGILASLPAYLGSLAAIAVAALTVLSSLLTFNTNHLVEREQVYRALATDLVSSIPPGSVVAASEIGTLGYFLPNATILDTQGLVSPISVKHQQQALTEGKEHGTIPLSLILETQPDFIITPEIAIRNSLLASEWFSATYQVMDQRHSTIFGSHGILAFQRRQQGQ